MRFSKGHNRSPRATALRSAFRTTWATDLNAHHRVSLANSRTFAADRLRWMANNPTERLPSSEPCDLELATVNVSNENAENNSRGRELSRELRDVELSALAVSTNDAAIMSAEQFPGNGVTRRYRTLRAEGLTPKYANEFSRSSKKYVQFRILSTTRPRAGALTYWDLVKCFDHKAAARTGLMKQLAASKKEIAQFKTQIERARRLLIRKYVDGIDALKNDDVHLIKNVAEIIGVGDL